MQAHAARARLPLGAGAVPAQPGKLLPVLAAIGRAEDGSIFYARIHSIGIGERGLQVPHPLELPGMLRAVVKLMSSKRPARRIRSVVNKLIASGFRRTRRRRLSGRRSRLVPCLPAVIGSLNQLSEPPAGLRRIQPVRVRGRSLHVVNLPAREVRAADVPLVALTVRLQNESAFARTDQNSHL